MQALEIAKATYGERHPSVASGFNNLAVAYQEGGELRRSVPLLEQAVAIIEKCYGKEYHQAKTFRYNLDVCRNALIAPKGQQTAKIHKKQKEKQ